MMKRGGWVLFSFGVAVMTSSSVFAVERMDIAYHGRTPEGLVGNGRSVVRVQALAFNFHSGGDAAGELRLWIDGRPFAFKPEDTDATFFPGGVRYTLASPAAKVDMLHGALADTAYFAVMRVESQAKQIELEVDGHGTPAMTPTGRLPVHMAGGTGSVTLAAGSVAPAGTLDELQRQLQAPYQAGLQLETPSPLLDRAIPFNRFLLDLGFDGRLHVCELFRWRDVWSRDLGSGLAPGAMISGQFAAARTTIDYDLRRYAAAPPRGLKVTLDPSQGGSAEGTAWLTRAVWRYYLLTGDQPFLAGAEQVLRPWVEAWIDRDADGDGLVVDVTEWMDHSRFFLFPDGARVLYSNVLFAELLGTFSTIERTLGRTDAARQFDEVHARFVRGINAGLWNESTGEYDNLALWGKRDARSSAAENALAVLSGVAPAGRVPRILATVREKNWCRVGSLTIAPPMTHVDAHNDHNYKMWPWWNAIEARARFRNGDIDGGVHLLECCSKTLDDEHYPGLMEELTTPEGVTEGGSAFLTAAGSYLDAVFEGLLGVEILEPGCVRLRVAPHVPAGWKDWRATVPLPQGELVLTCREGSLRVRVSDPRVRTIETPAGVAVEGAERAEVAERPAPAPLEASAPPAVPIRPIRARKTAVFYDVDMPGAPAKPLSARRVSAEELLTLAATDIDALLIAGNALPRRSRTGGDILAALARFLDRGSALVFYGATMHDRGTMGETGGVIDWYEYRPKLEYRPLVGWKFKRSSSGVGVGSADEQGRVAGWSDPTLAETDWVDIAVPKRWEEALGTPFDGWGWYRAHFTLPEADRGRVFTFDLGRIDDADWAFVNGAPIGEQRDWQMRRCYPLKPADAAYAKLNFGGDNVMAVQVFDAGGTGGLYVDPPRLGIETGQFVWLPIDPRTGFTVDQPVRHGVVSWGPGGDFFNSWETSRGAFGFKTEGEGAEFVGPLADLPPLRGEVQAAFTDFAISRPLQFEPLAFTRTQRKLLVPDEGERYPCAARIVNTQTGGEFMLIPAAVAQAPVGAEVLARLKLDLGRQ